MASSLYPLRPQCHRLPPPPRHRRQRPQVHLILDLLDKPENILHLFNDSDVTSSLLALTCKSISHHRGKSQPMYLLKKPELSKKHAPQRLQATLTQLPSKLSPSTSSSSDQGILLSESSKAQFLSRDIVDREVEAKSNE